MCQRRKLLEVRELTDIDTHFHRMVVIEEWRQITEERPGARATIGSFTGNPFSLRKRFSVSGCFRLLAGYINCRDAHRQSEVSKAEDPKSQTGEPHRPHQPIASLLESVGQVLSTCSTDGRFLDLPIHPAFLGDSLRVCEQPVTCLEKVDDARWRGAWNFG